MNLRPGSSICGSDGSLCEEPGVFHFQMSTRCRLTFPHNNGNNMRSVGRAVMMSGRAERLSWVVDYSAADPGDSSSL